MKFKYGGKNVKLQGVPELPQTKITQHLLQKVVRGGGEGYFLEYQGKAEKEEERAALVLGETHTLVEEFEEVFLLPVNLPPP